MNFPRVEGLEQLEHGGDILSLLFPMSIVVIYLLLFALIFFVKKQINLVESLQKSINTLNVTIATLQTTQDKDKEGCVNIHTTIDRRLNQHSKSINDHESRISVLEKT